MVRVLNVKEDRPGADRPGPAEPALRLTALSTRGPGLKDISFELRAGELLAVLGPSGSGKSALIAVLAGTSGPTFGQAHFGGRTLGRMAIHRRGFGIVRQPDALFPNLTLA
ncbi:MAG TPA: ATP-binding cassette domain-containing protein, partial [Acetobacteraceae bacterium]|nr:ATP-binding cassette domain-containing protein [Acetobacteraceae bacterium]